MKTPTFMSNSPLSLGGTPQRKLGSKAPWKGHKSRAEFRDNQKTRKPRLYYEPEHGSHNELFVHPKATRANEMPYTKRKELPLDIHRTGVVTLADAKSVRLRNLPLLFSKQLSAVGRYHGPAILKKVYKILFPTGHLYKSQDPAYRPKAGCIQTYFWDDVQVETWAHFANSYGITYSGRTEYMFPRGLLGKLVHNSVYESNVPWPDIRNLGSLMPITKVKFNNHRRSDYRRMMRALRLRSKEFTVRPLRIEQVLTVRKVLTKREIDLRYDHSCPISQFRESIPNCLSIRFGKPAQVPQIVLESLRRIYSTPKKFFHDLTWLLPKGGDISMKLEMKKAPTKAAHQKVRQIVVLTSTAGGTFWRMVGTGSQLGVIDTNFFGIIKSPEDRKTVIENYHKWQYHLDNEPDDDERPSSGTVLGSWFSQPT